MKKYLSFLLMLAVTIGAYASEFMVDGLNYSILSENEVELIGFSSESINYPVYQLETLDIPSIVEYNGVEYNVVSIGANAFGPFSGSFYLGNFTKVNIPSTVRSIGERAFVSHRISEVKFNEGLISMGLQAFGFNEISDIDFPNSLKEIGESAFCANPLETTLETKNIVFIGDFAFSGTSITSLIIGEPLQEIGARAFQECWGLTELKIPGNVVSIGEQAFRSCPNIKQLIIEDGEQLLNIYHSSFDFANNVISIGDPITGVGYEDDSMLETLYIGRQYKSEDKSTSGNNNGNFWSFKGYSRLNSLQFGGSLKEIMPRSFGSLPNLRSVTFPTGIEKVASEIFSRCPELSNIKIEPDENNPIYFSTNGDIGTSPFWYFKSAIIGRQIEADYPLVLPNTIEDVVFNGGFKEMNNASAFTGNTNLKKVSFDCQLASICEGAFHNCQSLEAINIPNTVNFIGSDAFRNCSSIRSIINSDNVTVISERTFMDCSLLSSIHIGESVSVIEQSSFSGCVSLSEIEVPNTLEAIQPFAFQNCTGLRTVKLGSGVKAINGFIGCTNLREFRVPSIVTWLNISEPNTYVSSYSLKVNGVEFEELEVPDYVREIYPYAFQGCSSIKSVNLNQVTTLGAFAFNSCSNLESIDTGNNIRVFSSPTGCTALKSLTLGANVSRLWELSDCDLEEVTCLSEFPPEADGSTFSNSTYSHAVLTVPSGTEAKYKSSRCWERFNHISEMTPPEITVESISLNEQSLTLSIGSQSKLIATISPLNATDIDLVWETDNSEIATVSNEGVVTAIGVGTCRIIVSSQGNPIISTHCEINVYQEAIYVEGISLSASSVQGKIGDKIDLIATISPADATNKLIEWSSIDPAIASVDDNGSIELLSIGSTTIIAKAIDGSDVTAECSVIVNGNVGIEDVEIDIDAYIKAYTMTGIMVYEGLYSDFVPSTGVYVLHFDNGLVRRVAFQ